MPTNAETAAGRYAARVDAVLAQRTRLRGLQPLGDRRAGCPADDDAHIADPRPGGIRPKAYGHGGRRFDIDDFAASQSERQRDTSRTPSDIDHEIGVLQGSTTLFGRH